MRTPLLFIFLIVIVAVACRRPYTNASPVCTATYLGYQGVDVHKDSLPLCLFGKIDQQTTGLKVITSFVNSVQANQAAYNTQDQCYYVLQQNYVVSKPTLFRVRLDGTVTALRSTSKPLHSCNGLLYNKYDNKLYVFRRSAGAAKASLCEISVSVDSYSVHEMVRDISFSYFYSYIYTAVDNKTGNIFFQIGTDTSYKLYVYHPGDAEARMIHRNDAKQALFGLAFNPNNNLLYCMRQDSTRTQLLRVSATGSAFIGDTLPFYPHRYFSSAVFDPCANHYVVAGRVNDTFGYYNWLDATGKVVRQDTTRSIFQGLTIVN